MLEIKDYLLLIVWLFLSRNLVPTCAFSTAQKYASSNRQVSGWTLCIQICPENFF